MSALQTSNAQLEELDCNTPNTPKLHSPADEIVTKTAPPAFTQAVPQARQSPARKKTISTSRVKQAPAKRRHVGPLIAEDDSKPANFTDLGSFGLLHSSVLLRPPFSNF